MKEQTQKDIEQQVMHGYLASLLGEGSNVSDEVFQIQPVIIGEEILGVCLNGISEVISHIGKLHFIPSDNPYISHVMIYNKKPFHVLNLSKHPFLPKQDYYMAGHLLINCQLGFCFPVASLLDIVTYNSKQISFVDEDLLPGIVGFSRSQYWPIIKLDRFYKAILSENARIIE